MEYYTVFIKVLLKEIERFKLDTEVYSTYAIQLTSLLAENFDVPYYRCAYMYRYATVNIYFFNDCVKKFLLAYSNSKDLFSMWKSYSEVNVCSLSIGPGLDYLGFMLAILEHDPSPPNFNGVKIISKHGAWRNTVNLILEVFRQQDSVFEVPWLKLKYENVDVIQADLLRSYTDNRKIVAVSEANVILMMKTLNVLAAGSTEEGPLLHMLKELISSLKSEAVIFCIDTKPSLALLTQAFSHFPGKFLYGPIHETTKITVDFPVINGCRPTINTRGAFFVWQKLPTSSPLNLCATPLANISVGTENKADNLTVACNTDDKSNTCTVEDMATVEEKDYDNPNLPWIELKTFWKCSSPKTKEIMKKLMLTNEESLEHISDIISQSEKVDVDKKKLTRTLMLQDIESPKEQKIPLNVTKMLILEGTKETSVSLNPMQDSSIDNLNNTIYNSFNLKNTQHEGNSCDTSDSPSPCDTLNSVSSFTSSSRIDERSTGTIPKSSYSAFVKTTDSMEINSEETTIAKDNYARISSCENKVIQTDTPEDIAATSSTIKALTERIRMLAISLESASQQKESNHNCGDFNEPPNYHTEKPCNFTPNSNTCTTAKPSCSKQSPNSGFKERDGLPSYESTKERNASFQNIDCHYSSQCCHMPCCSRFCHFQPCCSQPVSRCNFSCNMHQSRVNNLENFTSPNIVIPLRNISDNALLQIISVLKSESDSN